MSTPLPAALAHHDDHDSNHRDRDVDHNFLPDFARAAVGGLVALVAGVLLIMLISSWGGGPSVLSYTRELAGGFLAGFLVILVARNLSAQSS